VVRLAFVVPCHGREVMTGICMRQLARTCKQLKKSDIHATAVLLGDEAWVDELAGQVGFVFVRSANAPLGRKWNDGYEHSCRDLDVDYCVPFGSDDAIDWRLAAKLPPEHAIGASRLCTLVSPDGLRLRPLEIRYAGGDGIRFFPREFLSLFGFRPADDTRDRAIDTSIVKRCIERTGRPPRFVYRDIHQLQILGVKSSYGREEQLNGYDECADHGAGELPDALALIGEHYPVAFVEELRVFYAEHAAVAA
jgi:hypothetical protein